MSSAEPEVEVAAEEGTPRSLFAHLRENWHFLSFGLGVMLLFVGLALWLGPLRFVHRNAALERLREARELWEDGMLLQASQKLAELEPSLWRIEDRAGDAYFLMGVVSNGLAESVRGRDGEVYRAKALPYLREAVRLGVSPRWQLPLYGETGRALFNAGSYAEAVNALDEAVSIRQELEGVLFRRLLEGVSLRDGFVEGNLQDVKQGEEYLGAWQKIRRLPPADKKFIAQLRADREAGDLAAIRGRLEGSAAAALGEPDNLYAYQVDQLADIAFELGNVEEGIQELAVEQENNVLALSDLLARLSIARSRLSPPDYRGALADGRERMQLFGLPRPELDAARRWQAETLLQVSRPVEARRLLEEIRPESDARGIVSYLMARSYFDEGRQWEFKALEEWIEETPSVEAYGRLIADLAARSSKVESLPARRSLESLARSLRPVALKEWIASANYAAAANYYQKVLADLELRDDSYFGLALLEIGLAHASLGDYEAADEAYERAINAFPGSDFERAALFYRADAYRRSGKPGTLEAFDEAVAASRSRWARGLRNPHLSPERLREIFAGSWRVYQLEQEYDAAIKIAELYLPFAEGGIAYQMRADSSREYAEDLMRRAAGELYADAEQTRADARRYYERAGMDYLRAAQAEIASEQYPELLWLAAFNSYEGHSYLRAREILQELLKNYGGGQRDSAVNLLLARCEMSQGEFAAARDTLETFLSRLPRSPNRFEARIDLAECYLELAEELGPVVPESEPAAQRAQYFAKANELLSLNIDGLDFDLEPTALAWQRSLFVLGRLLHEQGRYEEAIARLREAIRRYPDAPQVFDAMYRIADANQQWAREPEAQLRDEETPRGRILLEQDRNRRLRAALQEYESLAMSLAKIQETRPLSPEEQLLMQSSFFAIGDVYAALEDWPSAIDAFTTAANRFQDRPDCLAAYIQIANAYLRQGRRPEAGSTLRQARWVLNQLDASLFADSALTKDQWKARLDSLVGDL